MLHSQKGKGKKKKKAAGSSEPTKETRFIHKVIHIHKIEPRRRALPTTRNGPRPPTPKHPNSSSWHSSSTRSSVPPRGLLSSENADRSLIQREAPASLHPHPAPAFPPTILRPLH